MSTLRTRAIVLRRTNYGEADRIVQLLTPEGKKSVIARGVRREKSKLAGGIELFAESDVVLTKGRGDLEILTSARLIQFYRHILDDYDKMQFAYEALKQIGKASDMVDEPEWYDTLSEVLRVLDRPSAPLFLTMTWFYLRYAALLGYELNLTNDTNGQKLQAGQAYAYDGDEKGLRVNVRGEITADHIKFMRLIQVKPLMSLTQIGGIEAILPACYNVARAHVAIS
jgi:DNA repair protein RecO (recombination protein O)